MKDLLIGIWFVGFLLAAACLVLQITTPTAPVDRSTSEVFKWIQWR